MSSLTVRSLKLLRPQQLWDLVPTHNTHGDRQWKPVLLLLTEQLSQRETVTAKAQPARDRRWEVYQEDQGSRGGDKELKVLGTMLSET